MIPPESPETTDNATPQKPRKAAYYQVATPEKVAEAVLRYRPPSEGPKPKQGKRWL